MRPSASSNEPEARLSRALWPAQKLGDALIALAQTAGLRVGEESMAPPSGALDPDQLDRWLLAAAETCGLQASQASFGLEDLPPMLMGAPVLIGVGDSFLAVYATRGSMALVVTPNLDRLKIPAALVVRQLRQPIDSQLAPSVDRVLDRMALPERRRRRAREALLAERARLVRFRSAWTLRLPIGSPALAEFREFRLPHRAVLLLASHVVQYVLFLLSWWLLGRGVLTGTFDPGWLAGWILLLLSLIPFRLFATWSQGALAITAGIWLRRRALRGAFKIDRQAIKRQGAGQLFGNVIEGNAIESLALSGGIAALFSTIELALALAVLWSGAGILPAALLAGWIAVAGWLAWRYFAARRGWTTERMAMTEQLLEAMVGHRTRLAQQPTAQRHPHEDASLASYIHAGRAMDSASLWLTAFVPRGWMAVGLATLAPAVVAGASPERLAISVAGILLAYRSLNRLTAGLSNLSSAAIAGGAVRTVLAASSRRDRATNPALAVGTPGERAVREPIALQARELFFRYAAHGEPVLQGCTLTIPRGAKLLLEGASGSGKSTLASILAGLSDADAGLLLADGLDASMLGKNGWRRRVVLAPQAHDNYLISGSLAFNLLMGRRWPARREDLAEAEAMCRELGLGDLLDRLPAGLHQIVGETGWQLSQGERARVFLARALLQNPDVLILDESFGALDPENVDRAARCVLRRAPTVVAIAHA